MSDRKQFLESFWMPSTGNRALEKNPRLLARANDMFYCTGDGQVIPSNPPRRVYVQVFS